MLAFSQLSIKAIKERIISEEVTTNKVGLPATLPFWDDFSIARDTVSGTREWNGVVSQQWESTLSSDVFVNSTLAINPPSFNVATFDGLDKNGDFHVEDNSATGLADELVSANIDLSSYTQGDEIFFSFYWQAGGNVELPEEGDSLVLQFMNTDSAWVSIWQQEGNENQDETVFTQQIFRVTSPYISKNFRFRFQSYGDLDGPFDAWHIDWIYINSGRTGIDNGYPDRAFTGDLSSPLAPFKSVPIVQFNTDNRFIVNQEVEVSNLNRLDDYPIVASYELRNTIDNTTFVNDFERGYFLLNRSTRDTIQLLDSDLAPIDLTTVDFSSITGYDSVVLETEISLKSDDGFLDGSVVDLTVNDTIRQQYTLYNYYAFDDGTAEFAAGTNIRNGQVGVKFWVEQTDTVTHVDIHFPNISPIPQTAPSLLLKVLADLTETGQLRAQQITVKDTTGINTFTRYELERPVVVRDTFYIAYQQFINDYIGIGLDRSNPEASQYIYENFDGDWIQNVSLSGALMIRPVFESGAILTLSTPKKQEITVYPNPTRGQFSINGKYDLVELLDMSGRVLFTEKSKTSHFISNFEPGLYLLRIHQATNQTIQKIILK